MPNTLVYLLQNLYNTPWPDEFDASAFRQQFESDMPICSSKDILTDFDDKGREQMGIKICTYNVQIRKSKFWKHWIQPIAQTVGYTEEMALNQEAILGEQMDEWDRLTELGEIHPDPLNGK